VEKRVSYTRGNYMVPVPQANSLEEINEQLDARCREELARSVRGKTGTKALRLKKDQQAFREVPAVPFDACRKSSTAANSLSLVRFDRNDYSVPVACAHHTVTVKGYVERVEIFRLNECIARHSRLWGKEDVSFEPLHYLALLEKKPGSLDYARPLEEWGLAPCFEQLRRRQEAEWGRLGTREYIAVLRLLEKHALTELTRAIEQALSLNALTRDVVAQLLYPQQDWGATLFLLDGHPHLREVKVEQTDLEAYGQLLMAGGER
jgi:hypothetical protein